MKRLLLILGFLSPLVAAWPRTSRREWPDVPEDVLKEAKAKVRREAMVYPR